MALEAQQDPGVDAPADAVDAALKPEPDADATPAEANSTDDALTSARSERDQAKAKRREAEERAESLEAELAELKRQHEGLAVEAEHHNQLREAEQARQREHTTREVAAGLAPQFGDVIARGVLLALAEQDRVDLEAVDAAAVALEYLRDAQPGMLRKDGDPGPGLATRGASNRWRSSAI